jgi:hypothetical protein
MKYHSLLIIASILLISCKKDDTVSLPDYKLLEVITQDGDTVYHVKYDNLKRPIKTIERLGDWIFEYGSYGVSAITYMNKFEGEYYDSTEYKFYYHPIGRLDSIQRIDAPRIYTYGFIYKNSQASEIAYDSYNPISNTHFTINFIIEYLDENIITVKSQSPDIIDNITSFEFDDKKNAFKSFQGFLFVMRNSTLGNPINMNNIVTSTYSQNTFTREEKSEYKYDEDDYPIERRTITFDGETSTASVWKYYYKED